MNLTPEDKFLLYCSRLDPTESDSEIRGLLNQALNWKDIVEKGRRHTVSPLLYHNLRRYAQYEQKVPKDAFQTLQSLYYANMIRNELTFKNLKNLLQAFKTELIESILLKGAALAEEIYGDTGLRIMVDVDILVKKEDIDRVEAKLNELGYVPCQSKIWTPAISHKPQGKADEEMRRWGDEERKTEALSPHPLISSSPHQFLRRGWHHITPYMSPDKSTMVEIHTDIVPAFSKCYLDLNQIWRRAKTIKVSGIESLALSAEDLILHLCLHLALNHRFEVQLIQLCDICEAIRFYKNLDWRYIIEAAEQSGAGRSVYYALFTSKRLLKAEISDQILKQFKPEPDMAREQQDHDDEKIVETICESILAKGVEFRILQLFRQISSEMPIIFQELLVSERISKSLKILIKLIFPSKDFMRVIYYLAPKSKMVYFYYLIRPLDLAFKLAKLAVMFICKPKSVISVFNRRKLIIRKSLR